MSRWQAGKRESGASELWSGDLLIADPELAEVILNNRDGAYERSSGFFRTTSHNPIADEDLELLARSLKSMLNSFDGRSNEEIQQYFAENSILHTQDFGPRYAFWFFSEIVGIEKYPQFSDVANFYLERLILRSSIRGKLPSSRHEDFEAARIEAGQLLQDIPATNGVPSNIVEQVLLVREKFVPEELGELYLRQLLALVGFSGIALEWQILSLGSLGEAARVRLDEQTSEHRFDQFQLAYPTAWRLIRTARRDHVVGDVHVTKGQEIILPTFMYHHPSAPRNHPLENETKPDLYIPFGHGPGACPGAFKARGMIVQTVLAVAHNFCVHSSRRFEARPLVLSLLAPRRQKVVLEALGGSDVSI